MIASSKVCTVQAMTAYSTDKQANNNPQSHTVLVNFDEIVPRPDKMAEGERVQDLPLWTLLMPQDLDAKDFGAELEKLGKAMQQEPQKQPKAKRGGGKKKKALPPPQESRDFDFLVARNHEAYLESIHGPLVHSAKKMK